MVKGKKKETLNEETILSKIDAYSIYRYYAGTDFELGKPILSPFRKEDNPSFSIILAKDGTLRHIDFTDTEKRGGFAAFVMQLYSLPYNEALLRIDRDLSLGIVYKGKHLGGSPIISSSPKILMRNRTIIQVKTKPFDNSELAYWSSYHISKASLEENNVYSVGRMYLNRQLFPLSITDMTFGYLYDDRWKIYRPLHSKDDGKWMTNVRNDTMSGMHRITDGCHTVVITKSKKDELVLANFLPYVVSTQNESTMAITKENIDILKAKCNRVFINFDSDDVGVQACKYYNQFGFNWVNCPKGYIDNQGNPIKDFADLAKHHGMEIVINHFKQKGII